MRLVRPVSPFDTVAVFAACLLIAISSIGCSGGGSSSGSGSSVGSGAGSGAAAPTVTSISPAKVAAGAANTTLTVTGSGFNTSTSVTVGSTGEATTFVSATQVTASIPSSQLVNGAELAVTALNSGLSSASLNLEVDNPVPVIKQLFPASVQAGSAAVLVVNGTGFVPSTTVSVNGSARPTAYTSSTQVSVSLPASDLTTVASLALVASNPAPAGGMSQSASLAVVSSSAPAQPTPVISSVNPTSFIANSPASSLTVSGSNLDQNGVILWNGSALPTTYSQYYGYGSSPISYLNASVPPSLIASVGTASITVSESAADPSVSNALTVSIVNPPVPTLTSISPNAGPIGMAQTITLQGTGFTGATTVSFNGVQLPAVASTNAVSATQLTVTLPASDVAVPGNGSFTVNTPAPGGGTSAALIYTAYIGITTNSMVYNPANGLF